MARIRTSTEVATYVKGRMRVFQELLVSDSGVRKVRHSVLYGRDKSMMSRRKGV